MSSYHIYNLKNIEGLYRWFSLYLKNSMCHGSYYKSRLSSKATLFDSLIIPGNLSLFPSMRLFYQWYDTSVLTQQHKARQQCVPCMEIFNERSDFGQIFMTTRYWNMVFKFIDSIIWPNIFRLTNLSDL